MIHETEEFLGQREWHRKLVDFRAHLLILSPIHHRSRVDYADLKNKPFFPGLVKYMSAGPVVAMVWEGRDAVKTGRVMLGATKPLESAPGELCCCPLSRNRPLTQNPKAPSAETSPSMSVATSATAPTPLRAPRRRLSCKIEYILFYRVMDVN